MRIRDAFKLAKWEMKIGKKEYILSVLVQGILLTCILFSVGLFCNIDSIVDSYLCKNNGNSYEFELRNFDESDKEWLFKKGFYDFLCSDGQIIYASTNSIEHIWTKKISALIKGKDIWNEETDKIIEVIGNYEYFYDVYGYFHFQEIKNYLNTTYTTTVLDNLNQTPGYTVDFSSGKSVYSFDLNSAGNFFAITFVSSPSSRTSGFISSN